MKKLPIFCFAVFFLCGCCCPAKKAVHEAAKMIREGNAECVLIRNGKIALVQRGRGVSPLLLIYEKHPGELKDSVVVDKVIGRAAAAIAICGKAKHVHALVMSEDGAAFLREHNISVSADLMVPRILNRSRSGLCPLEQSVENISDPQKALAALKKKIASFKK